MQYNYESKIINLLTRYHYQSLPIQKEEINIYYKQEADRCSVILLINNDYHLLVTRNNIKNLIQNASKAIGLPVGCTYRIAAIITTNHMKRDRKYAGMNQIVIDKKTGKMKHGKIEVEFKEVFYILKEHLLGQNLEYKRAQSRVGDYESYPMIVTGLLILFNIYLFFKFKPASAVDIFGISYNNVVLHEQKFRLLTYMFFHSSFMHLLNNMICLFIFGKIFESKAGCAQTLMVYIVGGIYGGILSSLMHGVNRNYDVTTVGASGAIYALLGASIVMNISYASNKLKSILLNGMVNAILIAFQVFNARVDIWAHIGGYLSGIIITAILLLMNENINMYIYNRATKLSKIQKRGDLY